MIHHLSTGCDGERERVVKTELLLYATYRDGMLLGRGMYISIAAAYALVNLAITLHAASFDLIIIMESIYC